MRKNFLLAIIFCLSLFSLMAMADDNVGVFVQDPNFTDTANGQVPVLKSSGEAKTKPAYVQDFVGGFGADVDEMQPKWNSKLPANLSVTKIPLISGL